MYAKRCFNCKCRVCWNFHVWRFNQLGLGLGLMLGNRSLGFGSFFLGILIRFEPNWWCFLREVVFFEFCVFKRNTKKILPSTTEAQSKQVKKTCLDLCPCICLDLQRFRITMFVVFGRIHFGGGFLGRRSFEFCSFGFGILSFEFVFCFWSLILEFWMFWILILQFWIFEILILDFGSWNLRMWGLDEFKLIGHHQKSRNWTLQAVTSVAKQPGLPAP